MIWLVLLVLVPQDSIIAALRSEDYQGALVRARKAYEALPEGARANSEIVLFLAEALLYTGKPMEARNLLEQSRPISPSGRARRTMLQGLYYLKTERNPAGLQKAEGLLQQATRAAEGVADDELWWGITSRRAWLFVFQQRWHEAEAAFVASAGHARGCPYPGPAVQSHINLALARLQQHRYGSAQEAAARALVLAGEKFPHYRGKILLNLGTSYGRLGFFKQGLRYLREAEQVLEAGNQATDLSGCMGEIGNLYLAQAAWAPAVEAFNKAYSLVATGDDTVAARAALNLAILHYRRDQPAIAEQWLERARERWETVFPGRVRPRLLLLRGLIQLKRLHFDQAMDLLAQAREANGLFPDLNTWELEGAFAEAWSMQGLTDRADAAYARAVQAIGDHSDEISAFESRMSFFGSRFDIFRNYIRVLIEQNRDWAALQVLELGRARQMSSDFQRETGWRLPDRAEVKAAPDTVYLSYCLMEGRSYLWVLGAQIFKLYELPGREKLEPMVDRYLQYRLRHDTARVRNGLGAALFRFLVAPIKADMEGKRVILVADGILHKLNFETLPSAPGRYWLEEVTLSVAPSLSQALQRARPAPQSPNTLLVVGNPLAGELGDLAATGAEIAYIDAAFPGKAQLLQGPAATRDAFLKADPGTFGVIHFAAHAQTSDTALDSAIILSPDELFERKLYARDILELKLNQTQLVVLSACSSAGSHTYAGEGLVGFSWAFLQAGAHEVVAGLWPVDDRATGVLMRAFYQHLKQGKPTEVALRDAKRGMLAKPNQRRPFFWGAFQVYGR